MLDNVAVGEIVITSGGKEHQGKMTLFVFLTCIVASSGGLIFGYDIGISGTFILIIVLLYSILTEHAYSAKNMELHLTQYLLCG